MKVLDKIFRITREIEESYYERSVRLKPIIESNQEILENARKAFEKVYLNKENNLTYLGSGDHHEVQNIGKIFDPINKREIYLATRLVYEDSYAFDSEGLLLKHLQEFENSFATNSNPPYFCSIITWKNSKSLKLINGMVLEDVTKNRKLKIREINKFGYFMREDGKRFFLDPILMDIGSRDIYLNEEARIFL